MQRPLIRVARRRGVSSPREEAAGGLFFEVGRDSRTPLWTGLATDEDGLVRGLSPRECGTHLAVGLVGHRKTVGRRRLRGFGVRGSQRTRISLRLDGVFIVQARKALEGVHR